MIVGESAKKIAGALNSINIEPSSIDAILITHEHSDHIKGISTFSKKYNVPVYANEKTWNAMNVQKEKIEKCMMQLTLVVLLYFMKIKK